MHYRNAKYFSNNCISCEIMRRGKTGELTIQLAED